MPFPTPADWESFAEHVFTHDPLELQDWSRHIHEWVSADLELDEETK